MSESTVKTHIGKVYDKLGAHNRASAVIAAVRLGLVKTTVDCPPNAEPRSPGPPTPVAGPATDAPPVRTSRRHPSAGSRRGR